MQIMNKMEMVLMALHENGMLSYPSLLAAFSPFEFFLYFIFGVLMH